MSAEAVDRFRQSTVMTFDTWHDGIGYDLDALTQMTRAELDAARGLLRRREQTWRELEALSAIDALTGTSDVRDALDKAPTPTLKLEAADLLHDDGKLDDAAYEAILCAAIRALDDDGPDLTQALLCADGHRTDAVKRAILAATRRPTPAAFHCGAMLLYLCGKAEDQLAMEHRPLLFDLQPDNDAATRQRAFDALYALVGMTPDATPSR